jgi:hypothetical protein
VTRHRHRIFTGHDPVSHAERGTGWHAFCSCSGGTLSPGGVATELAAETLAEAHADQHDGVWWW